MNIYLVRRHHVASGANGLDAALLRLRAFEGAPQVGSRRSRWRLSYVLREADGSLGLSCLVAAADVQALREHAQAVRLPLDEALRVTSTLAAATFDSTKVHLVRRTHGDIDRAALDRVLACARHVADAMAPRLRWLSSHALREAGGGRGSACLYRAGDAMALTDHARRAGLPAGVATPVLGRVVFRPERHGRALAAPATDC